MATKNPSIIIRTILSLEMKDLLAPGVVPKLEDHLFSNARDGLLNIFALTLHTWRTSPPSAN
jgi:hypothetical protein